MAIEAHRKDNTLITLNDYLYSGDTVPMILRKYTADLREHALESQNPIDMVHSNFLLQISELLEHNNFLASQSNRIREFYQYMAKEYPYLSFTFKGRIKSLIRAEEKFNGYVVGYITDHYKKYGTWPELPQLKSRLIMFRDLIAYRIIISMPKNHVPEGESREELQLKYLYEIANTLPDFLELRGFTAEFSGHEDLPCSDRLEEHLKPYYRDYVQTPTDAGYRSLHITFYDNSARCYVEVQLRTKEMDDNAEIGEANHYDYEKAQCRERALRDSIPEGENIYFDEAFERGLRLQQLDLSELDVDMFGAANNQLINDGCGLFRGRLIRPFEHLSRLQNDLIE